MMILQEQQPNVPSGSGYTWDESWILPYESIRSLIHKFAALNQISLPECIRLFRSEKGEEGISELGIKLSLDKVSRTIGHGTALEINLVDNLVHPTDRLSLVSPYLRTCPICTRHHFHSVLHQILSIRMCPVHFVELSLTTCSACGAHQMYKDLSFSVGKYSATPCICGKCGQRLWQPYDNAIDSSQRNLLVLTNEQKAKLDDLYEWLTATAEIAACSASLKRWESMSGLLFFPPPIGMIPHRRSIYQIRGLEIMAYRGTVIGQNPPFPIPYTVKKGTTYSVAQYGLRQKGWGNQLEDDQPRLDLQFNDSGILYSDADKALKDSLGPIYKSIRRHIAKIFLGSEHRKCARSVEKAMWWEPGPDSDTQICPWAFAYLFWRRHWEKVARTHHPHRYVNWKYFISTKISADDCGQNEWVSRRIFALECYWTFQEAVLLARRMHLRKKFSWDPALIRGRLIPYWYIDNQSDPGNPSIFWWGRQAIHFKKFRPHESANRHRQNVNEQAKIVYGLPLN